MSNPLRRHLHNIDTAMNWLADAKRNVEQAMKHFDEAKKDYSMVENVMCDIEEYLVALREERDA